MKANVICAFIGAVGAGIASMFGGMDAALITLMIFILIDYVTGLIVAGVFHRSPKTENGALESKAGLKGLLRKGGMLLMVLIACRLDLMLGAHFIRDACVIALISNEALSIIENMGLMGVPIPKPVINAIEVLKDRANEDEKERDQDG
jgi:toxin secretion/phage lysis holin